MPATQHDQQGLMPAYAPEFAVTRARSLPWGGPTGVGGPFPQGQAIGATGVAAQSEVLTLTLASTPSGTVTMVVTAEKAYVFTFAYNATLAAVQAALGAAVPELAGNVTVTGTPGSSYVFTFNNNLANQRIGANFTATITAGTATFARTTRGSCGAAQGDVYSQASNNNVEGFLQYATLLTIGGALVPKAGPVAYGQPFQPSVYVGGTFTDADLVGLDANAYTLGDLNKVEGGLCVRIV